MHVGKATEISIEEVNNEGKSINKKALQSVQINQT
jgi:hypothetical protein